MLKKLTVVLSLPLSVLFFAETAFASAMDDAMKLMGQRNYKAAAVKLEQAVKSNPNDSNACYYRALNCQYMGDLPKARSYYQQIIQRFPGTPAAEYASQAITPRSKKSYTSGSSGGSGTASEGAPEQTKVYFSRQGKALIVEAEINGRRIPMCFDTGASVCAFGKNHLQMLGINPPTGQATGQVAGVGSSEPVKAWNMAVDLKVGQIKKTNFPISVQEDLPTEPLLGQSFFNDFEYTIDDNANSIVLTKKGSSKHVASGGRSDSNSVPFTQEGNEMVVNVEVDGRQCQMYFDTGADGVVFSREQAKNIGLKIPDDAEEEMHTGVGGSTSGVAFTVRRMRLGPVEKTDMPVSVIEQAKMPKPLLGQTFYGGWQYTIDNQAKRIRFLRR